MDNKLSYSIRADIEAALTKELKGEIRFDAYSKVLYSTDASNYQIEPIGVVIPRTIEDISATVRIAGEYGVPILPRGGGTSLAGQAVGQAIVIDLSKYLNNISKINTDERTVRVQPGIYLEQLNRELGKHGLMFGPDPSTARIATVGGVVGNNATGAHSILYGMAGDNVAASKIIRPGGGVLDIHEMSDEALIQGSKTTGAEEKLYSELLEIREKESNLILQDFPKHWRRASGYSLNYFRDNKFNPAKLLAGSEGTLGVAVEFTLNLVDTPKFTGLTVLQFDDLIRAMEAVPVILEQNPSAIELIDKMLIDITKMHPGYSKMLSFIDGDPEAILVVEFYGNTEKEVAKKTDNLIRRLSEKGTRCTTNVALTEEAQMNIWSIRKAGLGLLMSRQGEYKPIPCIEDVSVPIDQLPGYVWDVSDLIARLGTEAGFYGHASAGCLHIRPLVNLKSSAGISQMRELTDGAFKLALKHGGVMSGEHGDGLQRSYLNKQLFGAELFGVMKRLKAAFDPDNMFNPGKIVDSPEPNLNLRYKESYKPISTNTYLDWSKDHSFAEAVEMCNGQGVCRKLGEGVMCPSYHATRDERDTTRARANALRAVLSGGLPPEELTGEGLKQIFDLCISCKACKSECPSSVDVAKMKLEFQAHYNKKNGIPLRDRMFGYIYEMSYFASYASTVFNFMVKSTVTKSVLSKLGIHPGCSLPNLSNERFTDWFLERPSGKHNTNAGKAVYFHDTWVSFYHPEIGKAAVTLLEEAGFEVLIVPRRVCCGRPLLSKGIIEPARERAKTNVALLAPFVKNGIPIIGTEPSCILTFRDEYLDLLPGSKNAALVAENSYLLDEFLIKLHKENKLNINWKSGGPSVLHHGHCHQKSLIGDTEPIRLLSMAGCAAKDSNAGCCGMAGSFGYENEHFEVSKTIAEDRLIPAIKKQPENGIISISGISCKHQVYRFTGRNPKHIAEVLADQIDSKKET